MQVCWQVRYRFHSHPQEDVAQEEISEELDWYNTRRKGDEGLFLITDTDYSESAKTAIEKYITLHQDMKITLWNQHQLIARLARHSHLLHRYGLSIPKFDFFSIFSMLEKFGSVRTLVYF